MATLQKIRSKGPLLVIVIGLALFAFIAEEAMRSFQMTRSESKQRVGEVYGEAISAQEFQKLVDEYSEVVKFTSGMTSLNDQQMTQLRDQVWTTYVNNKLIEHEAEKLGLTVTDAEVQSIIAQGKNPILMQTPFRTESGAFDLNALKKFLTEYEGMKTNSAQYPAEYIQYYAGMYNFWTFIEKSIRQDALLQKYQILLGKSLISNNISAKAAFEDRSNESKVLMAALPYSSINDNDIKIEEADLKAKYEELKENFKQISESRDIKYIDVKVTASAEDKAALDKDMAESYKKLSEGGDAAKIVRESGSVVRYQPLPISKNAMPMDIAAELDSMSVGSTKAPYYYAADNTMNVIKLINKISAPDSIEVRQIEIAGADANVRNKTADSIMTALNSGIAFDSIARKYNQTGEKVWITSSNYEGATINDENRNFIETINAMPVNSIRKVDFSQGSIVVQVTDKRAMINKYDVAIIKRPVEFSNDTYSKAYNDFSHFIAGNTTLKDLEANALKNGYNLQERKDLFTSEHYIGGVKNTRDLMRWIFNEDTEIGNISPLYECGDNDHMMVAVLTGVHKTGYRSIEEVKDILTQEVLKDKKAEMLKGKIANAKNFADVAKIKDVVTDTINHITFSSPVFIAKTGSSEPVLSGAASKTASGKFVSNLKGNSGVYAIQVISKNKSAEMYDEKVEKQKLNAINARAISRFANDLYENAEVTDNRYLFF